MGPVSGAWQTFRSRSWGRGRTRGPSLEWGPQGEPHTTCPVWPEDVILGKSPGPRHGSGVGTWRAAQDRLKDWPARWEPRNQHLALRTLLVVQSGTGHPLLLQTARSTGKQPPLLGGFLGAWPAHTLQGCVSAPRRSAKTALRPIAGHVGRSQMAPHTQDGSGVWGRLAPLPASQELTWAQGVSTHHNTQSPTLLLCWQKNQLFFTRHKACASNAMFTPKPFGSGRKKTCLFKKKKTTNTKPPLGNATDSRGPEQTL